MISPSESSLNKISATTVTAKSISTLLLMSGSDRERGLAGWNFLPMWDQHCIESDHQAASKRLPQDFPSSRAEQIRLLIVDDQPVFREGLSFILAAQSDMLVIGNTTTFSGAIEQFRRHKPNVMLLNHCLQGATGSGMQILTTLKSEFPGACIIVLTTAQRDVEIQRAFRAGATSYVLKITRKSERLETIRFTYRGRRCIPREVADGFAEHLATEELTAREIDVLRLIRDGNRNKQVAGCLAIAETTVNFHIKNLVGKLRANDGAHAVAIAFRRGLLHINRASGEHGFMPIRINPSMIRLTIGTILCAPQFLIELEVIAVAPHDATETRGQLTINTATDLG